MEKPQEKHEEKQSTPLRQKKFKAIFTDNSTIEFYAENTEAATALVKDNTCITELVVVLK